VLLACRVLAVCLASLKNLHCTVHLLSSQQVCVVVSVFPHKTHKLLVRNCDMTGLCVGPYEWYRSMCLQVFDIWPWHLRGWQLFSYYSNSGSWLLNILQGWNKLLKSGRARAEFFLADPHFSSLLPQLGGSGHDTHVKMTVSKSRGQRYLDVAASIVILCFYISYAYFSEFSFYSIFIFSFHLQSYIVCI